VLVTAACAAGWAGCGRGRGRTGEASAGRVDRALADAIRVLVAAQSADGAWRSRTYGALKDGLSLTPAVLKAVAFAPAVDGSEAAARRGAAYLVGHVRPDGSIDAGPFGMVYPVYTAAATVLALTRSNVAGAARARNGWLRELRRRQLTEDLGWAPDDPAYGGWGYSAEPPVKHTDGPPPDADLSSTLFAVGALRVSGAAPGDPALRKALRFVRRCQNVADDPRDSDPAFDDGGFFLTPTDPARNKAGVSGVDRLGRERYHSYGSATADGLRALWRCGLPADHPRAASALAWLTRNTSAAHNPGVFEPALEPDRDATYYYYAWSLAHALRASGPSPAGFGAGWTDAICRELIRRQSPDGSWSNPLRASKEDDPLIATPLAAGALGACRLTGAT
jgi:hypothetical protein